MAWRYCTSTRNRENITAKTTKRFTEPAASPRRAKIRTSSSGWSRRSSTATKATVAAIPATIAARVIGAVQPCSGPSWKASTSPPTATTESSDPTTSKPASVCSTECGTKAAVRAKETAASAIGSAKTQGQVALSMMAAETNSPMMPPAPAKPAQVPMALACSSRGKLVVMTERVTGMTMAAATPARTRKPMSVPGVVANAEARLVAAKATSPIIRMGLRPHRSPMAPTGRSSAASASV